MSGQQAVLFDKVTESPFSGSLLSATYDATHYAEKTRHTLVDRTLLAE